MSTYHLLLTLLAMTSGVIFGLAVVKVRQGQFYGDTFGLWWLGIFVWGDALVLAPFWLLSSVIFIWLPQLFFLRFGLLFFGIRFAYEVIYWLNHQAVAKEYVAPLFRHFTWLDAQQAAILYQLLNMVLFLISIGLLALTYA